MGGGGDAGVAELAGDDGDVDAFGAELGSMRVAQAELASRRCSTVRASATLAFFRPVAWGRNRLMNAVTAL
mgnify:CR=1 FL=1